MTPIYVFSGLGADERVFQLLDFTGLSVTFVQWIVPEQGEKISEYAHRPNSSKPQAYSRNCRPDFAVSICFQ